jgi:hypothetical protein
MTRLFGPSTAVTPEPRELVRRAGAGPEEDALGKVVSAGCLCVLARPCWPGMGSSSWRQLSAASGCASASGAAVGFGAGVL